MKEFTELCKVLDEERIKYLKRFKNVEECLNGFINFENNNKRIERERWVKNQEEWKKTDEERRKRDEEHKKFDKELEKIEDEEKKIKEEEEKIKEEEEKRQVKLIRFCAIVVMLLLPFFLNFIYFPEESKHLLLYISSSHKNMFVFVCVYCLYVVLVFYLFRPSKSEYISLFQKERNINVHGLYSPGKIGSTVFRTFGNQKFTVSSNLVSDKPFIVTIDKIDWNGTSNQVFKYDVNEPINDILPLKYHYILESFKFFPKTGGRYTVSIETCPGALENIKFEKTYFNVKYNF